MESQTKECPFCFTTIDEQATVCPQCRRDIGEQSITHSSVDHEKFDDEREKPQASNRPLIILGIVVGVILICGIALIFVYSFFFPSTASSPIQANDPLAEINKMSNGGIEDNWQVIAEGEIAPGRSANVSFLRNSRISELLVSEGDKVDMGTELARSFPEPGAGDPSEVLLAPFAGSIANIYVVEGETALAGTPVITIADFDSWQVKTTDLTELDIVAVTLGAPATIQIDSMPGVEIQGTVAEISDVAQEVRGDVTYEVTIDLTDVNDLPLRWGMTVFVNIDDETE